MGVKTRNLSNTVGLDIEWQGIQTGNFTAVAGRGYFVNTTNAAITVTLPGSPSQGDTVVLKDYARTWNTNNVTTASALFDGGTASQTFSTNGQTVTLVYMDGTKGWSLINEDTTSNLGPEYIAATGGTVTESGDYKIHTFTGDGCFVVSQIGNPIGSTAVDYLVVAGGGGSGGDSGGGSGGGGLRFSNSSFTNSGPSSPRNGASAITVSVTTYPITVGGGGAGTPDGNAIPPGTQGSSSSFSTITSAGGGFGGGGGVAPSGVAPGGAGGSGGGARGNAPATGGSGNSPPVSPSQGLPGGSSCGAGGGAGGGFMVVGGTGANGSGTPNPGFGGIGGAGGGFPADAFGPGNGQQNTQTGPAAPASPDGFRYFAGGGMGGTHSGCLGPVPGCNGALGGGGVVATYPTTGQAGSANMGGGGAGGNGNDRGGGAGGKGIVVIRYKYQ